MYMDVPQPDTLAPKQHRTLIKPQTGSTPSPSPKKLTGMGQMYMEVPQPDTNTTGLGAAFFALPLNCGRFAASVTSARGPNMW